jgi:UDP-N-acetylglucosamine acyltransferase
MSGFIHPTAIVDASARLGDGAVIDAYAIVGPDVTIGARTRVRAHAHIECRTVLGDDCDIHPGAVLGADPQDLKYKGEATDLVVGDRNVIRECVTINRGTGLGGGHTVIGCDNMIMAYVHVAHDCRIGNGCLITNASQLSGHVAVEDMAIISGLVAIHHFVTIGSMAFVAGHATVRADVPPYMIVDGNPARVRRLNAEGMRRRGIPAASMEALERVHRLVYQEMNWAEGLERIAADPELASDPYVANLVAHHKASQAGQQGRALEAHRTDQHTKSITQPKPPKNGGA